MLKIICSVILLMILAINVSAIVDDDDGKVITEAEIKKELAEMRRMDISVFKEDYYLGGCLCGVGGGCLCFYGFYVIPLIASEPGGPSVKTGMILATSGVLSLGISVYLFYHGSQLDRYVAIERIKEQRHSQKQNEEKSLTPENRIILPLFSGRF